MKKGPRCTRVSDKGLGWAFLPLKSTINFLKIDYLPACGRQIPKITYMIGRLCCLRLYSNSGSVGPIFEEVLSKFDFTIGVVMLS